MNGIAPTSFPPDMSKYVNITAMPLDMKTRAMLPMIKYDIIIIIYRECIQATRRGKFYRGGQVALLPKNNTIIQTLIPYFSSIKYIIF